ncbi:MAG: hypothetical protein AB7J35_14240 [Dehalococcoidia bacterium]
MAGIALSVAAAMVAVSGCLFGGDDDDPPPTANAEMSPTASATPSPSPKPTPDRLATPPVSQADARDWLMTFLDAQVACNDRIRGYGVGCAEGDVDGDGDKELGFLVPVTVRGTQLPHPSAVFVLRGKTQKLEEFAFDLTADSSLIGLSFFGLEDRNGDGNGDLTFLENRCGATACMTTAVIMTWDGTAWRDIGPAGGALSNVDSAAWMDGENAFTLHGGKLPADAPAEAGPSRASTSLFHLGDSRYELASIERDPPEYLYQAFLDADEVFERDKEASIPAFEALLGQPELKDWKAKPGQKDRRPSLEGFALFRILLADAVLQRSPATITAAIDRLVLQSREPDFEPLFVNIAEVFRKNYNPATGVIGACAAVNLYLSQPAENGADNRAYVEQLFDYGYANPPGRTWLEKICPY